MPGDGPVIEYIVQYKADHSDIKEWQDGVISTHTTLGNIEVLQGNLEPATKYYFRVFPIYQDGKIKQRGYPTPEASATTMVAPTTPITSTQTTTTTSTSTSTTTTSTASTVTFNTTVYTSSPKQHGGRFSCPLTLLSRTLLKVAYFYTIKQHLVILYCIVLYCIVKGYKLTTNTMS